MRENLEYTGAGRRSAHKKSTLLLRGGTILLLTALLLTAYNIWSEKQAELAAQRELAALYAELDQRSVPTRPLYTLYPDLPMPAVEVDADSYIGTLDIPALGLSLPVMQEWSYPNLRKAPCCYRGSAYTKDLIIAAHNYASHFGNLKNLDIGSTVNFTDTDGNVFCYEIVDIEILPGTAVKEMVSGDWDLTLFTCTYGGQNRVTVRCQLL